MSEGRKVCDWSLTQMDSELSEVLFSLYLASLQVDYLVGSDFTDRAVNLLLAPRSHTVLPNGNEPVIDRRLI